MRLGANRSAWPPRHLLTHSCLSFPFVSGSKKWFYAPLEKFIAKFFPRPRGRWTNSPANFSDSGRKRIFGTVETFRERSFEVFECIRLRQTLAQTFLGSSPEFGTNVSRISSGAPKCRTEATVSVSEMKFYNKSHGGIHLHAAPRKPNEIYKKRYFGTSFYGEFSALIFWKCKTFLHDVRAKCKFFLRPARSKCKVVFGVADSVPNLLPLL